MTCLAVVLASFLAAAGSGDLVYTNLSAAVTETLPAGKASYNRLISYGNAAVSFKGTDETSCLELTGGTESDFYALDNRATVTYGTGFYFYVPVTFTATDEDGGLRYLNMGGAVFYRPVTLQHSTMHLAFRRVRANNIGFYSDACIADFSCAASLTLGYVGRGWGGVAVIVGSGAQAQFPETYLLSGSSVTVLQEKSQLTMNGDLRAIAAMYLNGTNEVYTGVTVQKGTLSCRRFVQEANDGNKCTISNNGTFIATDGIELHATNGSAMRASDCTIRTPDFNLFGSVDAALSGTVTLDVSALTTRVGRVSFAEGTILKVVGSGAVEFNKSAALPTIQRPDGAQLLFREVDPEPVPGTQEPIAYEDFGAKGDGVTDDLAAIVMTHEMANIFKRPVRANDAATYYIGGANLTAAIKTDVDFGTAHFIIDDGNLENRNAALFRVQSDSSLSVTSVHTLKKNATTLGTTLPARCCVCIVESDISRFKRWGPHVNTGSAQQEVLVVNADGTIDPLTPPLWDYTNVTSLVASPISEKTLVIKGGYFKTLAHQTDRVSYFKRGITINRSNVRIEGVHHDVEGEETTGATYGGFIDIDTAAYVTAVDCVLTAHRTYQEGTYDILVTRGAFVTFRDCTQTIDILDTAYWGIIGANFTRDFVLDGCTFSRFDTHQGVFNARIRNSILGHQGIEADGWGTFLVENTTNYGSAFFNLRNDYGSTWEGEVIARNCTFIPNGGKSATGILVSAYNYENWDFGYDCTLPWRITFDNLTIDDSVHPNSYAGPYIFSNVNPTNTSAAYQPEYPIGITERVILNNVTTKSGKGVQLSTNKWMFRNVVVEGTLTNDVDFVVGNIVSTWSWTNATLEVEVPHLDASHLTVPQLVLTVRNAAGEAVSVQTNVLTKAGTSTFTFALPEAGQNYVYEVMACDGARPIGLATIPEAQLHYGGSMAGDAWFSSAVASWKTVAENGAWEKEPPRLESSYLIKSNAVFNVGEAPQEAETERIEFVYTPESFLSPAEYQVPENALVWTSLQDDGAPYWAVSTQSGYLERLVGSTPVAGETYTLRIELDFSSGAPRACYRVKRAGDAAFTLLSNRDGEFWLETPFNEGWRLSTIEFNGEYDLFSFEGRWGDAAVAEVNGVRYDDLDLAISDAVRSGRTLNMLVGTSKANCPDAYLRYLLGVDPLGSEPDPLVTISADEDGFSIAVDVAVSGVGTLKPHFVLEASDTPNFAQVKTVSSSSIPLFHITQDEQNAAKFYRVRVTVE